jgi:hypothetical protein
MLATRIKKRPYSFASWLISLLLLIAIAVSWFSGIKYITRFNSYWFSCGELKICFVPTAYLPREMGIAVWKTDGSDHPMRSLHNFFSMPRFGAKWYVISFGYPMTILNVLTSWRFWRSLKPPAGHCQSCGYNLQANTSGTCPECGTPLSPSPLSPSPINGASSPRRLDSPGL